MGLINSKTSDITRTMIEIRVNEYIENSNKNVINLIIKQIDDTIMSFINKSAIEIQPAVMRTTGMRKAAVMPRTTGMPKAAVMPRTTVYEVTPESQNKVVIDLINDNNQMNKLTNNIIQDLKYILTTDEYIQMNNRMRNFREDFSPMYRPENTLSGPLELPIKLYLAKIDINQGGIQGIVDKVIDIIKNMGPNNIVTENTETQITNNLLFLLPYVDISNKTIINKNIENTINNIMSSINDTSCNIGVGDESNMSLTYTYIDEMNNNIILERGFKTIKLRDCICNNNNITEMLNDILTSVTKTSTYSIHPNTYKNPDVNTYKNPDVNTYKNPDVNTYKNPDVNTYKNLDKQQTDNFWIYIKYNNFMYLIVSIFYIICICLIGYKIVSNYSS